MIASFARSGPWPRSCGSQPCSPPATIVLAGDPQAGLGHAQGGGERGDLLFRLARAFGKKRFGRDGDLQSRVAQLLEQPGRKLPGHEEGPDAKSLRHAGDQRDGRLLFRALKKFAHGVDAAARDGLGAVDFQR